MDISKLTLEQKEELRRQLEKDEADREAKKIGDIEAYKKLKDETITSIFEVLKITSESLLIAKDTVFEAFGNIINLKNDLYKVKTDRQTDTFTSEDGRISIKIGNRVYEGWDDTMEIGVAKVKEFLKTLAKDDNSAMLVETVMGLLRKDRKGSLKASKVLELEKLANETGSAEFKEGIKIIKDAYRPTPSCQFVEVRYKDESGKEFSLPLSMSAIDK